MITLLIAPVLFVSALALYYGLLVRIADRPALRFVLARSRIGGRSVNDIFSVVNIVVAAVFQLALVLLLIAGLDLEPVVLLVGGLHPLHIVLAPVLAIMELAASAMLAVVATTAFNSWQAARSGGATAPRSSDWRAMLESGWVRSFMRTDALLHRVPGVALLLIYLGGEEFMFRGVGIAAFSSWGTGAAVFFSALLFILIQPIGMPGLRQAIFPVAGAMVMGPVHAILAVKGVPLVVLIGIHTLFFLTALATAPYMTRVSAR